MMSQDDSIHETKATSQGSGEDAPHDLSDAQGDAPEPATQTPAGHSCRVSRHAFVCIFKDYKRLEALLLACVERGLPGGTLMDARGMGQVLCQDIPLFIHLRERFPAADGDSYVFLSVVDDEQLDLCFELAERIGGAAAQGVAFSTPVGRFRRFSASEDYFTVDAVSGASDSVNDATIASSTTRDALENLDS